MSQLGCGRRFMKFIFTSLLAGVLLCACSSKDEDDHVFKTQEKALNKAKDLQNTIEDKAA